MRKALKALLMSLTAVLFMSGCVMTTTFDVSEDGTIKEGFVMMVSDSTFELTESDPETEVETMKSQYLEEYPDAQIEAVKETRGNETYRGIKVTGIDVDPERDGVSISIQNGELTFEIPIQRLNENMEDSAEISEETTALSPEEMAQYGVEMKAIINMPSAPKTNIGTVEGNTVTVDLFSEEVKNTDSIIVTCKVPEKKKYANSNPALFIIPFVAFAAVIAVYIVTKKNKRKREMEAEVADYFDPKESENREE